MSSYRHRSALDRPPLQRRASGLALAVGVNLLVLLALLNAGIIRPHRQPPSTALVVDLLPESHSVASPKPKAAKAEEPRPKRTTTSPPAATIPPPRVQLPAPDQQLFIPMTSAEMAAADVRNLPKAAGSGSGSAGDSEEVGRGPHGETLYAAEWARRPTHAELRGYLPPNAPDGWGMIACKTIPGNRVDNCVEVGNDPPGPHLASAVRQAAWQFRVRPPRKDGKPMIGEWVRIRIEYSLVGGV